MSELTIDDGPATATELTPTPPPRPDAPTERSRGSLIRSGLYSMGDRVAALVFGFGSLWMLTRMTTVPLFGVWVFFMAFVGTVEVARSGLIQNALIRYLTTSEASEHGRIYGGAWVLNVAIALIGAAVFWWGGPPVERIFHFDGLAALTKIYAVTFLATTPLWQYNYLQQAHLEFRGPFWATILRFGVMFVLTAAMFFGYYAVDTESLEVLTVLAYGQLIAATVGATVSYVYAREFLPKGVTLDLTWAKRLAHFGKYVFGTNLSSMLYKQVDIAMLGALLASAGPAAIYGLAMRITQFVDVPTLAVASIVFPESSRASESGGPEAQARMYERAVAGILSLTLPALLVVGFMPGLLVDIVGGSKYAESIPVLQVTVLFSLFIPFANQFGTLLDASGAPELNFRYTATGMVINVISNYFFITNFGVIGAPLGTLTTYTIMFFAMQRLLNRRFGVRLSGVARALPDTYKQMYQFASQKLTSRS